MPEDVNAASNTVLADGFNALPENYRKVLILAQEKQKIKITPLQELKGGRTGAFLYLVSVMSSKTEKVRHLILKLDRKSKRSKSDELERHTNAIKNAPVEFSSGHIADLAFERIELDESVAIFYSIAGQSLQHYQSLASHRHQSYLEKIFSLTNEILLSKWNSSLSFTQAVHPQKILVKWLGYRLNPGGNIEKFIEDKCLIPHSIPGLLIQGNVFPNPYIYAGEENLWEDARPIDTITGYQHGDLNIGNILVKFDPAKKKPTGFYIIDFALYKPDMPLLYDQRYLEVSYLIRELSRTSFSKWNDLVTGFSSKDIIDPGTVPVELAGACAVINAGRKNFKDWVQNNYPSLSDDLWGQFHLAAVAAGLNYCNKEIISPQERLAGLIYAAVHLKRYMTSFGMPLPVEIKHLVIAEENENSAETEAKAGKQKLRIKHNLPNQTTPFIGRQKEVNETSELLRRQDIRLLTLIGPGGTGKTRLASQLALDIYDCFDDGIYFVDLAPVNEPAAAVEAIARVIGLRDSGDQSLLELLKSKLSTKKMLLLLDNFEQVTAAAPLLVELLRECPDIKFLVTSRESLHLRAEHIFQVPPLAMPGDDIKNQSIEELTQFEAIRLFIGRATAVKPDFKVTNDNVSEVTEICSRLDGLPLAIELAAARISLFSPKELLERVGNRLKLLRGGARDLPVRQQTLKQTIDWSYDLLNEGEKRLFVLLSLFSDCTFKAVEKVASEITQLDEIETDVFEGLTSLADKSLIRRTEQYKGESRLMMLETIREYAGERLKEDKEYFASARRAHADYFADYTQLQWNHLKSKKREAILKEIETDLENIRTAWKYWLKEGNLEQLHKLTNCLWMLYDSRGWYNATADMATDLLKVLSSTPSTPDLNREEIMLQTSLARILLAIKGPAPEVEEAYTRALELCRKHEEIPQSLPVLRSLASFYVYIADFEKSADFGNQILNLANQINDTYARDEGYLVLGYSLAFSGNLKEGLEYMNKVISGFDYSSYASHSFRFGNHPVIISHTTSAICLWALGYPDRALKFADDALVLANKLNHPYTTVYALFHTGLLHLLRREAEITIERAELLLKIAEDHEFKIWKAVGTVLQGAGMSEVGRADEGLAKINLGIELYSELRTPPVFWPMLLLMRAGTYMQNNQPEEGLKIINEALNIFGQNEGNPLMPEYYRLKSLAILMKDPENVDEAESVLLKALEIARKHDTRMLELKSVMSLNKIWLKQGKTGQFEKLLNETYGKLTEGFTTVDLKEALNLLSKPPSDNYD